MPFAKWAYCGALIFLALILGNPAAVRAQTRDVIVQISDLSGPNSPITASGHVHFQEILSAESVKSRYDMAFQLTNASSKTILAYEVSLEAMPDYGSGFNDLRMTDSFFLPQLEFMPGAQESENFSDSGVSVEPRGRGNPHEAKASFKVIFVEFADGSKFGASPWAQTLASNRQRSVQRMQEIEAAFDGSGEMGFRDALATAQGRQDDPQDTLAVMNHFKGTLDSEGAGAAVNEIREFLTVAQARKDIM